MAFKAMWENNSPYSKLLLSVGIILISAVFFTFISSITAGWIFGMDALQMQGIINDLENPVAISILKWIQAFSSIGVFVVPPFILAYFFHGRISQYLHLEKKTDSYSVLMVLLLMMIAVPLINFLGEINQSLHLPTFLGSVEDWMRDAEDKAARLTQAFIHTDNPGGLMINILIIGVIPALGEELLFRGLVQRLFTDWSKNKHTGVWTAAVLFSAMHMQFYGFLPRLLLGALLGYLLVWSGSLWLPVLAHFVNNAAAVIFTYLYQHNITGLNPDEVGTGPETVPALIFSILVSGFLIYQIHRYLSKKRLLSAH